MIRSTRTALLLAAVLLTLPLPARAAIPDPGEDIEWSAEHLPEAAMDLRYLVLPLPAAPLGNGFQWTLQLGGTRTGAAFIDLDGLLASAGATWTLQEGWGLSGLVFYDSLRFSGGSGRDELHPLFNRAIPLDLPEHADFSHPRGDLTHRGAGLALVRQTRPDAASRYWTFQGGALWEDLELDGFQLDYTVATGASAGAAGVLDHSATYRYITPFAAVQWTRPLGARFSLTPRVTAAVPNPKSGFDGRLTGPGFDLRGDTASAGHGKHMGDPYVGFGLELEHRPTGLAIDLGATLWNAGAETVIHHGIDRPVLLTVAWHPHRG
jgi:hypothetical protein